MEGRCRFCGCAYRTPCPGGCAWTDDSMTLCTACRVVDEAWRQQARQLPNMRRAFFRGFAAAAGDPRATERTNPYASSGDTCLWWDTGFRVGQQRALAARKAVR